VTILTLIPTRMTAACQPHSEKGWTFVEMLVAISLSAVFLGAASLVLASISVNSKRLSSIVTVTIGNSNKQAYYGQSGDTVSTYSAPNYGKASFAMEITDLIREDAASASFLHCLHRALPNTVRPEFLRYPAGDSGSTLLPPRLDTPEDFRTFLAQAEPTSAGIYDLAVRNVPTPDRPNTTLFIVGPAEDPGFLRVKAVYEIDYLSAASPAGTYATVRRYRNGTLTHYYDIFYEAGPGSLAVPSFVAFENTSRRAVIEGSAIDRFKIASHAPFYLLWLPDPSTNPHKTPTTPSTAPATAPLSAYEQIGTRSSLCIALPMFPGL